jgi:hypothetical protein
MNRESQIVGLAADHQIQGVDRRAKARTVLAAWEWIGIINRVLAVAAGKCYTIKELCYRPLSTGVMLPAMNPFVMTIYSGE